MAKADDHSSLGADSAIRKLRPNVFAVHFYHPRVADHSLIFLVPIICWTTVMNAFWRFLRDKHNQQVLGWLGGGLVVALTGLWVAFVYFFPPGKSPEAKSPEPMPPSVQADCGGVAIGGNVTGATITGGTTTSSDCGSKPK